MTTIANKTKLELLPPFYPPEGPEVAPDHDEELLDSMQQGPHIHDAGQTDWTGFYEAERPEELPPLVGDTAPMYYKDERGDTKLIVPDFYFAFNVNGRAIYARNAYFVEEVGKAPEIVFEVGSVSTFQNDIGRKREIYLRLGVREYWGFDPTGGYFYGDPLFGKTLVDGEYIPIEIEYDEETGVSVGYSPILDMYVRVEPEPDNRIYGEYRLRFQDRRTGQFLKTPNEASAAWRRAEAALRRSKDRLQEYEDDLQESETARGVLETELNIERAARRSDQARIRELEERLRGYED